jgi:hypothetical protein
MHSKSTCHLFLFLALALAGCIKVSKTERRVVELPAGDSRTSLATAEQICRDLVEGGFYLDIQTKFPALTQEQLKGLFLTWNFGKFQSGDSVFITTGINYQGNLSQAKDIADHCQSLVARAVTAKFILPAKPAPK